MIKGIWADNDELVKVAHSIRQQVFIEEQGIDPKIEFDDMDDKADIFVVYNDDNAVGTGRVLKIDNKYLIGRIAVKKEVRGQKFGDLIVRMLVRRAFDKGANGVFVHAQIRAKGFYEKLGFEAYGKEYENAGIKHINMVRRADFGCSSCGK